jgi:hypothetical protein
MAERTGFKIVHTILPSKRLYPLFRYVPFYSSSIKDLWVIFFLRTRMVNKGKKFGSTGHILSGHRQYTFFFKTLFSNYQGGGGTKIRLNDYPRPITPSQKILTNVISL